ncbi:type II pantothenate kinase [Peribacillus glennii]|uniref:Type II pantothenate kinase n=1 Tax=Peribacillus glennii TaxID=2303991 RepID=A0A372L6W1_9BACI|nr:type II pantothenate kinase [Peribacillus glennii]RFU60536.1 type II pantothenate kinase [Peribacillus glennii]
MSVKRIGIDAGGSLIKLAYFEDEKLHVRTHSYHDMPSFIQWMGIIAPNAKIVVTGGKSRHIQERLATPAVEMDEFAATPAGAAYLLQQEAKHSLKTSILVNIGTGTSFYLLKEDAAERIGGTGVGGGTLLGLGNLLVGTDTFKEIVSLAGKGKRSAVDLQVKDIYEPLEPPIPGHFTASNFGKAFSFDAAGKDDLMAALVGMIAETVMLMAVQAAASRQIKDIVYFGGTVAGNLPLQSVLKEATHAFGCRALFLDKGEYSGAVGALLQQ